MTETIIGLLRHGQTDWNIDFRLQGTTDIPLNETGLAQARAVAEHIYPTDWDVVVASPLSRARDTARLVSELAGLPEVAVEPLLMERAFGIGEGMTYEEWRDTFKDQPHVEGSESLIDLADRCLELLEKLRTDYPGKRVLTVSHGALIRKVIELVSKNKLPNAGDRFGNTSLSLIAHSEDTGWRIVNYYPHTYAGEKLG